MPKGYDFPFRGCLVHYEAPEIARSVLATGEAEPTEEADIYALGASLLISATGWRAMEYPDDAPRSVQREAVANGRQPAGESTRRTGRVGRRDAQPCTSRPTHYLRGGQSPELIPKRGDIAWQT